MKSEMPKVLHEVCGRPMLHYVLSACRVAGIDRLVVVVGHGKDEVMQRFGHASDVIWVEQAEQKGTGHAVACCREALAGFEGSLLVIAGDMPLVRRSTLAGLHEARLANGDSATMATTVLDDPSGYGRIVRDEEGNLSAIVEDADCTLEQRAICEVNPSYYCFDSQSLFETLERVQPAGPKNEIYLTEVIRLLRADGLGVSAPLTVPAEDATGINARVDLAVVNRLMQDRLQRVLLDDGVTIVDPDNTWIEAEAMIGRDTVVLPFTFVGTGARVGSGCRIGPFGFVAPGDQVADGETVGPGSMMSLGVTTS